LVSNVVWANYGSGDVMAFVDTDPLGRGDVSPELLAAIVKHWRFAHNWRDLEAVGIAALVPLALLDKHMQSLDFMSPDESHVDFLRPTPALFEAMRKHNAVLLGLPPYAGAVPPAGVEGWDWKRLWRALRPGEKSSGN
jgi:hypothetical protein